MALEMAANRQIDDFDSDEEKKMKTTNPRPALLPPDERAETELVDMHYNNQSLRKAEGLDGVGG